MSIEISADGKNYYTLSVKPSLYATYTDRKIMHYVALTGKERFRFLKVRAINSAVMPETHPAKGKPAWIFADEIVVR